MKVKIRSFNNKLIDLDVPGDRPIIHNVIVCLEYKYGYKEDHIHLSCKDHSVGRNSLVVWCFCLFIYLFLFNTEFN